MEVHVRARDSLLGAENVAAAVESVHGVRVRVRVLPGRTHGHGYDPLPPPAGVGTRLLDLDGRRFLIGGVAAGFSGFFFSLLLCLFPFSISGWPLPPC